jgi:hypothetical protein
MSFSMTRSVTETFTFTHAKRLASKVMADMLRCQGLYGYPSNYHINNFGTELAILLRDRYVKEYEFGYKKDEQRILSWQYRVDSSGDLTSDDRPGKIVSGVSIADCLPFNLLTHSSDWYNLTEAERKKIEEFLPIKREAKEGPIDGNGYWVNDLCYSSNGIAMARRTFRPS